MGKKHKEILVFEGLKHFRCRNTDGSVGGWVSEKAKIGKNVFIASEVIISGATEIPDNVSLFGRILTKGEVKILSGAVLKSHTSGSEYWLFENCTVPGVKQECWPKRCS